MLTSELYEKVLLEPSSRYDEIFVVSGYASATLANRHLREAENVKVNLIVGMPSIRPDHLGFLSLYNQFPNRFVGYYLDSFPYVHAKLYGWRGEGTDLGYSGSANYTQNGFLDVQRQLNQLVEHDPKPIFELFNSLIGRAVEMRDYVPTKQDKELHQPGLVGILGNVAEGKVRWETPGVRVRISFLQKIQGEVKVPERSGLNWGQRPEQRREPNQAYLSIKGDARADGFLPERGRTFTLITDDGKSIDCVVAQDGRKAIQSTKDNSELGRYLRMRFGVPLGNPVTRADLERYGRTDFTIEKLNEETFILDVSV